jgi:cell filamentation protein
VWAGRPRAVGIARGGTPFCPPQNIDAMMSSLFTELEREHWLEGLNLDSFIGRAAYYTCEINAVHPFREGNGRATRFYVDVLSAKARGDIFDWTKLKGDRSDQYSIRINDQWRICFDWKDNRAENVEIADYH